MANLSVDAIEKALTNLADPKVNFEIDLASTPHVASRIIQSLPGVKELTADGPAVADALLARFNDDQVLDDEYFALIGLHILSHYPSERVKRALAKPISEQRFSGFGTQFAAEAFLKAAGIDTTTEDAIATALVEARKLEPVAPTNMNASGKIEPKLGKKIKPKAGGKIQPKAGGKIQKKPGGKIELRRSGKPSQKKMTSPAKSRSQKKKSRDSGKSRYRGR